MKILKTVLVLVVVAMLVFAAVGCGQKADTQPSAASTQQATTPATSQVTTAQTTTQASASAATADKYGLAKTKTKDDKIKIGVVVKQLGAPYFTAAQKGVDKAATDLNAQIVSFTGPSSEDVNQEITFVQDLITKGVDALLISTADSKAITPTINAALKAGVAVFTFDIDAPESDRLFCITAGNAEESGAAIGKSIVDQIGGKGQVALLTGGLGSDTLNRRLEAIKSILAKNKDIQVVATEACDEDFQKCVSQVENLIQQYPDLKAVAGVSTVNPPAAAQAIKSSSKAGKIISLGIALPSQIKDYVDQGIIPEAILWDPGVMGYVAVAAACNYLRDGTLPVNGQDYGSYGGKIVVTDTIAYVPSLVFTSKNVHDFGF